MFRIICVEEGQRDVIIPVVPVQVQCDAALRVDLVFRFPVVDRHGAAAVDDRAVAAEAVRHGERQRQPRARGRDIALRHVHRVSVIQGSRRDRAVLKRPQLFSVQRPRFPAAGHVLVGQGVDRELRRGGKLDIHGCMDAVIRRVDGGPVHDIGGAHITRAFAPHRDLRCDRAAVNHAVGGVDHHFRPGRHAGRAGYIKFGKYVVFVRAVAEHDPVILVGIQTGNVHVDPRRGRPSGVEREALENRLAEIIKPVVGMLPP